MVSINTSADSLVQVAEGMAPQHDSHPAVRQPTWLLRALRDLPAPYRRLFLIAWDCLAWVIAGLTFALVRFDLDLSGSQWLSIAVYMAMAIVLQVIGGLTSHVYLGRNRVGSFTEATWVGALVVGASVPLGLAFSFVVPTFPKSMIFTVPGLALMLMSTARWMLRAMSQLGRQKDRGAAMPVLLYGAGDAGYQVSKLLRLADEPPYSIVGVLDDDPSKHYLRIDGQRVVGTGEDLVAQAKALEVRAVILAITHASQQLLTSVSEACDKAGVKLIVLPPVDQIIGGRVSLGSLREFNVTDLLGRRPIKTDLSQVAGYINGKVVLVTGAGGSIGSELARQVFKLGPSKLILLDRDESALHAVQLSIYNSGLLDTDDMVLCDIRDYEALKTVFEHHQPDVVFHAAALKHLPMLERFPLEGWKTNVLGSRNVLRCAREVGVTRFVNISTDKAADASSVLGQTKRQAERLTAWVAQTYHVPYVSVRFGNVLGSRGSVLYTFKAQIERGDEVTVTHPDVTRYFMTIPEACQLVLQAGAIGTPGDVLVLDMGEPVRIVDVAKRLIAESGKDIKIRYTGLRHGEKLHEVLFSNLEEGTASEHPLISQVSVPPLDPAKLPTPHECLPALRAMPDQAASHGEAEQVVRA